MLNSQSAKNKNNRIPTKTVSVNMFDMFSHECTTVGCNCQSCIQSVSDHVYGANRFKQVQMQQC